MRLRLRNAVRALGLFTSFIVGRLVGYVRIGRHVLVVWLRYDCAGLVVFGGFSRVILCCILADRLNLRGVCVRLSFLECLIDCCYFRCGEAI